MRFLRLLILAAAGTVLLSGQSLSNLQGWCTQGAAKVTVANIPSLNWLLGIYPTCTVTVYITGGAGTKATIFSDSLGTPLTNPFTASGQGFWDFWVNAGTYDVTVSGGGMVGSFTFPSLSTASGSGGGGTGGITQLIQDVLAGPGNGVQAATVVAVNHVAYPTNPGVLDYVPRITDIGGGGTVSYGLLPNDSLQNSSITINTSGPVTGGGTVALGGTLNLTAVIPPPNQNYTAPCLTGDPNCTPFTGAVVQQYNQVFSRVVDVSNFGADPTGAADSSSAFQAAVSTYNQRPGGVGVYVPCGTYLWNSTINIPFQNISLIGEGEHCVVFNYTGVGTGLNITDTVPTGGPHGVYANFTIKTPNATTGTIGMSTSTSNALFQNIQVTSCAAGQGIVVSNGTIQSPLVWYDEKNVWQNVNADHCARGFRVTQAGASPPSSASSFTQYNDFESISAAASMGQIGFSVDPGTFFWHNTVNLACKIDNATTISSSLPAICIQSSGNWKYNTVNLNGEWNNGVGTGTGNPYSVQVIPGGTFLNTLARVNVFFIPGLGGARVPMDNQAGAVAISNFQVGADTDADWETGTGAPTTTPANGSLYTDLSTGIAYNRQSGVWVPWGSGGGGGGGVGFGTAGQLAYYAVNGNAVTGETTLAASQMPALGGDLFGTAGSLSVAVQKINGGSVPASAFVLGTNSSSQPVALSVANNTVLGNVSGSVGPPSALSTTQLTTLCNQFTSSLPGCVAASGGGTVNFLRADGTWAAPPGSGGGGLAPPASGSNCVVKFDTGTTSECVPTGSAGYVFQDGAGNISISAGTGGTASSISYTPTGTNAGAINQQIRNDEATYITEWKNGAGALPVCGDTATDNSASVTNAAAAHHLLLMPPNCILTIQAVSLPSQTVIQCGTEMGNNTSGFLLKSGATTSSIFTTATSTFQVGIHGCVIDGNGVNTNQPLISIGSNSSSIAITGNVFRQNSSPAGLVKDIQIFQSSARILNNNVGDNPSGTFLVADFGTSTTARVLVQGNNISGVKDNAIVMERSGSPGYCNFLVSGNTITNVTDSSHGTGPDGNGILQYQCWGGEIANNHIDGTELSGIREGQNSAQADIHDNEIWNAHEAAMYCSEMGGFGNHCHHNHIYLSTFGINSTNQSSRILGLPDVIDNNYIYGMQSYGIHAEGAQVLNNHVFNSALCYQLGAGSTTGGNEFSGNTCDTITTTGAGGASSYNNGTSATITNIEVDPGTNSAYIERLWSNPSGNYTPSTGNGFLGGIFQLPTPIVGINNSVAVTGITNATSAVVSYSGTDVSIAVGNLACFQAIFGMAQANGQCPVITAVGSGNFTVAMNSSGYGTFVAPTNGIYSNVSILWNNTTNTPITGIGGTYQIRGMDIPYIMATNSSFATGSQFNVPDGGCTNGALTSGGGGTFVTKITSRLACTLDASGTVSSGNGITNGGPGSGQINMLDSTSGHTLTVTPQSGLPANTTVNLPQ